MSMTEIERQEAINWCKIFSAIDGCNPNHKIMFRCIEALEEIQQYRAIGTVEEFKALKEKNEPKNWNAEHIGHGEFAWQCPTCKKYLSFLTLAEGTPQDNEYNFCPKCGQAFAEVKGGAE